MELTPLRYVLAIARAGHITRAAQDLGVTQPALSAMLKKLEAEVGAALFHRTGRGVEPTEAGRAFLERAARAVQEADAAQRVVRELQGLEHGSIRIGGGATATGYLLPAVVPAIRDAHPGLRFFIREAGSRAVGDAVISGELDLGIVTLPLPAQTASEVIIAHRWPDELRLIVPPAHRLARKRSFAWADLRGEPVVAFEAGSAVREAIDAGARDAGVALEVVMELRSIESIKQMVAAGIGVGFISRFAISAGSGGGRSGLACADGAISRELALIRRADRVPSAAAARFEDALVAMLPKPA